MDSPGFPASNSAVCVPGPSCCSCPPTPGRALLGHARPAPAASGAGWSWGSERGAFNLGTPHPCWDESRLELWLRVYPPLVQPPWGCRHSGAGLTQSRLWLESSTNLGLAWPGTRVSLWPLRQQVPRAWGKREKKGSMDLVKCGQLSGHDPHTAGSPRWRLCMYGWRGAQLDEEAGGTWLLTSSGPWRLLPQTLRLLLSQDSL